MITTNEERALPDAFLRRCLVLHLSLPADEAGLIDFLVVRGRAHFPRASEAVLRRAAEMLFKDRQAARAKQIQPRPGQAEYLDLLRAALGLARNKPQLQLKMLDTVAQYTLKKHLNSGTSD